MSYALIGWRPAAGTLRLPANWLPKTDPSHEIPALEEEEAAASRGPVKILAPRDPEDAMDVILEIKAGEGGEESALLCLRPGAHVRPLRRGARLLPS